MGAYWVAMSQSKPGEVQRFLHIATPSVAVQILTQLLYVQTGHVVGRDLGKVAFGSMVLGSTVGHLSARSLIMGMLSAFDTLGPRKLGLGDVQGIGILAVRSAALSFLP